MKANTRIEALRKKIREANDAYWIRSVPIMTDTEYDRCVEDLKNLSPNDPLLDEIGHEQPSGEKVVHKRPMLSLGKFYSWTQIVRWCESVSRSEDEVFMVSPKYDGISLEQQGDRIITRGDGKAGNDITHLSDHISVTYRFEYDQEKDHWFSDKMGLSEILAHEDDSDPSYMYGELLIPYWRFDKLKTTYPEVFEDYKTPRNMCSGFANIKNDSALDLLNTELGGHVYIADFVSHRAFEIPVTLKELKEGRNVEAEIMRFINNERIQYPVDGIVLRLADDEYAKSLGVTQHHPLGSMAFKFTSEQARVVIKDIVWQIGKERISPVAEFDPVQLDGVMVKRATLHNARWMVANKVGVGATAVIERRGKVIPSVMEVINNDPNIVVVTQELCPACGAKLEDDGTYLRCPNPECDGKKANKIVAGLACFGIKGCGHKLVTKAIKEYYIRDIIDWFLTFGTRNEALVNELRGKGFSTNDIRLLTSVETPMRDGVKPETILMSVCIPKCSQEFAHTLEFKCGGIENVMQMVPVDSMYDEIVGKCKIDAVTNFMQYMENNRERFVQYFRMFKLLNTVKNENIAAFKGVICFTGAGPLPRKELQAKATLCGYVCSESPTACDILVAEDPNGDSSKLKRARASHKRIISYDEFMDMIS